MHLSRKNRIFIICLLSLLLSMAAVLCVSAVSVSNATGKICDGATNLRKSASTSSKSLALLKDNTNLTIKKVVFTTKSSTSATNRWYYVTAGSKSGYVRSDCVDTIKYKVTSGKTKDALNYRKGAGTSMSLVGTIAKGKSVSIVLKADAKTDDIVWYKIKKNSKYYYVSSKYVKLVEPKSESSSAKEETKTPTETQDTTETTQKNDVTFTVKDLTHPTELKVGSSFSLKGKVTCNKTITKVKFGIIDADGDWLATSSKNVNAKTFDVSKCDSEVRFGRIIPGEYKYVGYFYVNSTWYKTVIKKAFTVTTSTKNLTDKIVKARITEMKNALAGKYFTTDGKACWQNDAERCNVTKVVAQNSSVKSLIKENKGSGTVNAGLFPHHYNPNGDQMTLGWSCCGFAAFAGWYVGADKVSSNVDYMIAKLGCNYDKATFSKYARVGDLVRTPTHSFMVISVKDDGCEVIDSNWGCTCICSTHVIKWSQYDKVTISRATTRK